MKNIPNNNKVYKEDLSKSKKYEEEVPIIFDFSQPFLFISYNKIKPIQIKLISIFFLFIGLRIEIYSNFNRFFTYCFLLKINFFNL